MSALPRRGFLSGLVTLPLIGGSIALIGHPTAAAVPITDRLLDTYDRWLDMERSALRYRRYGCEHFYDGPVMTQIEVVFRDRSTGRI